MGGQRIGQGHNLKLYNRNQYEENGPTTLDKRGDTPCECSSKIHNAHPTPFTNDAIALP